MGDISFYFIYTFSHVCAHCKKNNKVIHNQETFKPLDQFYVKSKSRLLILCSGYFLKMKDLSHVTCILSEGGNGRLHNFLSLMQFT